MGSVEIGVVGHSIVGVLRLIHWIEAIVGRHWGFGGVCADGG